MRTLLAPIAIRCDLLECVFAQVNAAMDEIVVAFYAGVLFIQRQFMSIDTTNSLRLDFGLDVANPAGDTVILVQAVANPIGGRCARRNPITCAFGIEVAEMSKQVGKAKKMGVGVCSIPPAFGKVAIDAMHLYS